MRPDEREFLSEVLKKVENLPAGLSERLLKLVEGPTEANEANEERSDAIRRVLEEHSGD